ncbi:hypothetical protein [Cupriavidus sp. UYPR2.512]|uniref:hypothetical protein n=1 Tax=Cupriavidus sp. UYPR2.512 TaxID=1080187 RepID=UPI0003823935|nr:hypothetical protein [Cupriavidus sp. UYPR2.512]UIF87521.1 hypothetical protein KAF44_08525 [Cupriavidus necator]
MAVDFSLLPKEVAIAEVPPSRLFWGLTFILMAVGCGLAVLLIWPKHLATNTWRFWISLFLLPLGVAGLTVLRRYALYEGHKLDVLMRNEAVCDYNAGILEAAARPLAVVGTAHRFSSDRSENAVQSIKSDVVRLESLNPIFSEGDPVQARWLHVPGVELKSGARKDDESRQMKVVCWLFSELLEEMAERLASLPSPTDLGVHLWVSGGLSRKDYLELWQQCWVERRLRRMHVIDDAKPVQLDAVDSWLDQLAAGHECEARLFVTIQLYPLLSETPPVGAAEAGVAVLLMPGDQASRNAVACDGNLHRPVQGPLDQLDDAICRALQWGELEASQVIGGWQTGLGSAQTGILRATALNLKLSVKPTDLDQTVGHAGIAAPWLAVACGAKSLSAAAPNQILFCGQMDSVNAAIVRRVEDGLGPGPILSESPT